MKKTLMSAACLLVMNSYGSSQMSNENIIALEKKGAVVEKDSRYPQIVSYKLKNGLTLLILEKHFVPTISFTTMFKVGNVDNLQGKSGLAHLFEHMAFKGTKIMNTSDYAKEKIILDKIEDAALRFNNEDKKANPNQEELKKIKDEISKLEKEAEKYQVREEYWKIYNKLGQSGMNAFTSTDYTGYVVELPSNRLNQWMIVESDRFLNPVLREFYKERSVVLEELRMNQADPNRVMWQALLSSAFIAHPYKNPTIGWEDDVQHLTRTDAEHFKAGFYAPNNCTMAIVGDVNALEVINLTEKHFAKWKKAEIPNTDYTKEPPQNAEKTVKVFYNAKPAIKTGYKIPAQDHQDIPALTVLSEILSNGKTSRFYKEVVENKKIALYANSYAGFPGDRYPSLFIVQGAPKEGISNEQLDAALMEEIEKIKKEPPTQWEMDKVINNYEMYLIAQLESNAGISSSLANNQQIMGDWKLPWKTIDQMKKLKGADIQEAAKKYLIPQNKTAVYLVEKK